MGVLTMRHKRFKLTIKRAYGVITHARHSVMQFIRETNEERIIKVIGFRMK